MVILISSNYDGINIIINIVFEMIKVNIIICALLLSIYTANSNPLHGGTVAENKTTGNGQFVRETEIVENNQTVPKVSEASHVEKLKDDEPTTSLLATPSEVHEITPFGSISNDFALEFWNENFRILCLRVCYHSIIKDCRRF